ncbi:MAG: T9SS type A sorting domain-containing protein [Bacteroidota bacterium]|nr:MAG: T9SS type A sorting domain-containing protein [Bacteroidota bacterium]
MKKTLLILTIAFASFQGKSQWLADGTALSSTFSMTDLNGSTYDAFTILNQGKHLVIDFSATWCGPCFAYHQSKVLDRYYDKFGTNGTITKDAQVVLYEVDPSTTLADLQGTTGATQGDWITGTTHPICNPSSATAVSKFLQPGTTSFGVPAVFVVYSDKKLYKISTGITQETNLRNYVASKCGLAPLSATEIQDLGFSYDLYPNPANHAATLKLNMQESAEINLKLTNSLGAVVYAQNELKLNPGIHDIAIPTESLSTGIYFLQLQVGQRTIQARVAVSH